MGVQASEVLQSPMSNSDVHSWAIAIEFKVLIQSGDLPCMRDSPRWTEMPQLCTPPQEISLFSACLKFCLCRFSGWLDSICQNDELLMVLGVLVLPAVPDLLFQDSLICSYVSLLVKPQGCSSPSLTEYSQCPS